MARKLRIEYPGAIYHIINRGNYRRDLFESPGAAESFLRTLAEAVERYQWRIFAYVLMRNHFHLAIETPKPNLVDGMHWLQSTVATRFNRYRQEQGHLFQGRYQSILVEDFSALAQVVDYIHLNPSRAKAVPPEHLCNYRWSSLFRYLRNEQGGGMTAQDWLHARGGWKVDRAGWTAYRKHLEDLSKSEQEQFKQGLVGLSRGWAIGTPAWRQTLAKEFAHKKLSTGMECEQIHDLKQATWSIELESALTQISKTRDELMTRPRANKWKLLIAGELRKKGAPISWIAEHLKLGKPSSVRSLLCRAKSTNSGLTP